MLGGLGPHPRDSSTVSAWEIRKKQWLPSPPAIPAPSTLREGRSTALSVGNSAQTLSRKETPGGVAALVFIRTPERCRWGGWGSPAATSPSLQPPPRPSGGSNHPPPTGDFPRTAPTSAWGAAPATAGVVSAAPPGKTAISGARDFGISGFHAAALSARVWGEKMPFWASSGPRTEQGVLGWEGTQLEPFTPPCAPHSEPPLVLGQKAGAKPSARRSGSPAAL